MNSFDDERTHISANIKILKHFLFYIFIIYLKTTFNKLDSMSSIIVLDIALHNSI